LGHRTAVNCYKKEMLLRVLTHDIALLCEQNIEE
jgi:hypothetical protein